MTLLQATGAPAHDAKVTSNLIMGSGVTNGGWTVDTTHVVELGLRAKVRNDTVTNAPTSDFNSNSDGTCSHAAGSSSIHCPSCRASTTMPASGHHSAPST